MARKSIRVGVVGVGRGRTFAGIAPLVGMELVALCDTWKELLQKAGKQYKVATYSDYDRFLRHEMDAVILANFFHEHAPFAIKALQAGRHVMSETMACRTPAEGVALARAVEQCGRIYMFAENYPYFAYNQEMRRLYRAGEVGQMQYGEGEYVHPMDARAISQLAPGMYHWRNWLPSTYYCSHGLAPLMFISDTRPVSVNALSIPFAPDDPVRRQIVKRGDIGSTILCRMDNAAVVRVVGLLLRGHGNWYRIHGTRGLMENLRHGNQGMLRIVHEPWDLKKGELRERIYAPDFPAHAEHARAAGHGGGDFFVAHHFAEAIRTGKQPYLNVYRGLDMAMVAIQAWRSCLVNGMPFEVPDLRRKLVRKQYEQDRWSPWPEDQGSGQPPPSIQGWVQPGKEAVAFARKVWREMGYRGK